MYVMGISCYGHDATAAILENGRLVALIEEERLSRIKHTWRFPRLAMRKCLEMAGISIEDVDLFTYYFRPHLEILGSLAHMIRFFPGSLNLFRASDEIVQLPYLKKMWAQLLIAREIQREFSLNRAPRVEFVEHHLCHAASAFFHSGFERAAVLTVDGRGESTSTMMGIGIGNRIVKLKEIKAPHSLGFLYAAITKHLGFKAFFDEWKIMGMAAYGKPTLLDEFSSVVELTEDGGYLLDLDYFRFHTHGQSQWVSEKFIERFGPARLPGATIEQRHYDLAFALQRITERAGVHMARHLRALTGAEALCLSGGVALNVLMNRLIVEQSGFSRVFIQPVANDAGASFGSASFAYHHGMNRPARHRFESPYLGPEYTDVQIEQVLRERGVRYRRSDAIAAETAKAIAEGKIVGWFQGRMEAGPRALGNRSIVVDPRDAKMKDRLNARVKKRESFRPFAPSVLIERCAEFFEMPMGQASPYMILAGKVKEDKNGVIPAVTHADGTARVHTVDRQVNPRYWQLIDEFGKITGVPILLNTSFNENEPIVCSPEDAVNCFLRTEFDVLAIGDFYAEKS